MARFSWFKSGSGEIISLLTLFFVVLCGYVFKLSFELILMGVRGEFKILAEFKGNTLYFYSVSPGLALATIMAVIIILSLPKVLRVAKEMSEK